MVRSILVSCADDASDLRTCDACGAPSFGKFLFVQALRLGMDVASIAERPHQEPERGVSSPPAGRPRATIAIAASLTLLLLVLASIAAALRRRHSGRQESESLHPQIARLFTADFGIDDIGGPVAAEGGYPVVSAKSALSLLSLLVFGRRDTNNSASRRPDDAIKELDKL
ncbi:hypothetical protein MRX96_025883 [Rhipicephalus microplus]